MWSIALDAPEVHRSVATGRPVSAWKVIGATKRIAFAVIATSTATPSLTQRRASSAAL